MNLATWRLSQHLTRAALGEQLGISGQHVRRLELGREYPDRRILTFIERITEGEVIGRDFASAPHRLEETT